jgi:hypothetical protein
MGDNTFDFKYTLLPPTLQAHLWVLGLDANTSKVNIAYTAGAFRTSIAYNYGSNFEASVGIRRYTLSASYDPSSSEFKLGAGLVYQGFNFQTNANITQRSVGLSLTYGRKILPFPDELSSVFNDANSGLISMAGDIRAAPSNPLQWYKLHSNDADAISKAVAVGRAIADQGKSTDRYGLGLRLNYSEQGGFLIYGAVVGSF